MWNPTEGPSCCQKQYVGKRTDKSISKMKKMKEESRNYFKSIEINLKLIERFWRSWIGYSNGASYGEFLKTYFSGKSKEKIDSHRNIYYGLVLR